MTWFHEKYEWLWIVFKLFQIMKQLGMEHIPHDCRHTTATALSNAGVESMLIKLILWYANTDITERVYTHKTHTQLVQAIDKIHL